MGCSSSKQATSRDIASRDTSALVAVPKTNNKADQARYRNETGAGGTTVKGKNDEQTVLKKSLILKRRDTSMEGRHNQSLVQNLVHDEFRRQITEVYDLRSGTLLGKGGFGTVQTVIHKQSGKKFALKAVELSRVKDEKSLDFFFREVEVMRKLDHPNICRLHAVYPTVEHLFLVMDFCEGGDLLTTYHFKSEQDAAEIVSKVTNAVRYMHDRNIAHRDLKLDNILKYNADDGPDVKLVDFGLSAHFEDFRLEHDVVGTWVYMAPEVISGAHFPRTCDMWSIGVIAYLLLCGYPPFGGSSTAELKEQIQHGTYQFHHDAWSSISARAKNFIKRLLVRNPQERMSAAEAQHHPWLNPNTPKVEYKLSNEALSNLVSFRNTNYLKKLALELVARSLDSQQIRDLEKDFAKMDKDGSGTISLEEFESVLAGQANLSQGDIHALFDSVDVDNGKEINFNEFLAATLGKRALDERRLRLAFDRLDFDHSGTIDAKDLKMIVGCDLGDEVIETIFSEFDENSDGLIDFEEFKVAMRKADAPEVKLARFRTFKSNSLPHRTISNTIKELERTIHENGLPQELGLQAITYSESDDPALEPSDRETAVIRASLVRCASKLIEKGQSRRSTVAVSDPAAQRAMRDVINHINGATSRPQWSGGLDPLPELKMKSDQTNDTTSRAYGDKRANIDDLEALPANWDEEPSPWGCRAVTAASIEVKHLQ